MTSRIYLLRHGIAVPHGTPGVEDDARPLTPKGERRVQAIASGLKRLGVAPDLIVTSPLPRALRTAEIVAGVLGREDHLVADDVLSPRSPAASVRDWVAARSEDSLMLVGHNPGLTELLGLLLGLHSGVLPFELGKAGAAEVRALADPQTGYQLRWLASPRMLRKV